jgi:AraC family transcriptional regulator
MFSTAIGRSAMSYARSRRLSLAAEALSKGAPDILDVAISVGYSSHEAFTRAFRDEFGATPDFVRSNGLGEMTLTPTWRPTDDAFVAYSRPRYETASPRLLAGIRRRYFGSDGVTGIPDQWREFGAYFGAVPGALNDIGYGVNHDFDQNGAFSYLASLQLESVANAPVEFATLRLAGGPHAVFEHVGHITDISKTMRAIWEHWLPEIGYAAADSSSLEIYDDRFDADSGEGVVEIWVPIEECVI